ncbi:hypothetical protein E2542_SST16236 [Spatholobus suberectus]|nr:hypothetical protein E2542_SST16236 [Spatholobus suberectus]
MLSNLHWVASETRKFEDAEKAIEKRVMVCYANLVVSFDMVHNIESEDASEECTNDELNVAPFLRNRIGSTLPTVEGSLSAFRGLFGASGGIATVLLLPLSKL